MPGAEKGYGRACGEIRGAARHALKMKRATEKVALILADPDAAASAAPVPAPTAASAPPADPDMDASTTPPAPSTRRCRARGERKSGDAGKAEAVGADRAEAINHDHRHCGADGNGAAPQTFSDRAQPSSESFGRRHKCISHSSASGLPPLERGLSARMQDAVPSTQAASRRSIIAMQSVLRFLVALPSTTCRNFARCACT